MKKAWLNIKVWFAWHLWRIAWAIIEGNSAAFQIMEIKRKLHNDNLAERWIGSDGSFKT